MSIVWKLSIILPLLIACCFTVNAQQCGNCSLTPIVALYDLDVQVPEPKLKGEETQGWLEWLELFWLAKHANEYLFQNNKDCIRFMVGPDQDANDDGTQENYKVGATYTHLPHQSYQHGYLTTGFIRKSGESYQMHLELQSACDRKKIAESDVNFQIHTILNDALNIGQKAAIQLMPLSDKIREFELNERKENKKFAIAGISRELLEIIPSKKTLTTGQQTELEIRLLDCDGIPLSGREINFSKSADPEIKISGTIGGTVTPSIVTTDNDGKAKVIFKMTASGGKPAIINAHSLIRTPENCNDALIGSVKIDLAPAYKVTIHYQKTIHGNVVMKSSDSIFAITLADEKFRSLVYANTSLYHYTNSEKDVHIDPEKISSNTIITDLRGYSDQSKNIKVPVITVIPLGASHKEGTDSMQLVFSSEILYPHIQFSFEGDELKSFDFDFNFKDDKSGRTPDSGGILIMNGDKEANFTKRKIADTKNSLFKTEHIIRYSRKTNSANQYGQSAETEFAEIVVLSTF